MEILAIAQKIYGILVKLTGWLSPVAILLCVCLFFSTKYFYDANTELKNANAAIALVVQEKDAEIEHLKSTKKAEDDIANANIEEKTDVLLDACKSLQVISSFTPEKTEPKVVKGTSVKKANVLNEELPDEILKALDPNFTR